MPPLHAKKHKPCKELSENILDKCLLTPTNLKITITCHVFSHAGACMHANPEIDERGRGVTRIFEPRRQ